MNILLKSLAVFLLTTSVYSQVTNIPNISVIGNFLGSSSDESKTFEVKEIEFSFQHYLYPGINANVFTALHKEESGERVFELEEAYVDFTNLTEVFFGNNDERFQIGSTVGKKFLNVGKINALHPEQWNFVDRSTPTQYMLGGEENLSAEGAQASYLLPLPFFSQIEAGYWTANADTHEGEEHSSVEYTNRLFTARLWNGFELSETDEIEISISNLVGNATATSTDDKQDLLVYNINYLKELNNDKLTVTGEVYSAEYGEDGEARETQDGFFLSGHYSFNNQYEAGIRYGFLGKHGDEGDNTRQYSYLVTKRLTETSKFRIQVNTGDNIEDTVLAQFIFGMGPHSHVLQ